jgi:hypothetical protein
VVRLAVQVAVATVATCYQQQLILVAQELLVKVLLAVQETQPVHLEVAVAVEQVLSVLLVLLLVTVAQVQHHL